MSDTLSSLEAWLVSLDGEETAERVDALNALLTALPRWSDVERRLALATEARTLAQRLAYTEGYALATVALAYAHLLRNDALDALPLYLEAEMHDALLPQTAAFWVQTGLANVYSALGDFENVLRTLSALLDRVRAAGDRNLEAWTLHGLSRAASDLGDAAGGLAFGRKALHAFTALGADAPDVDHGVLRAHAALGTSCRLLGHLDEAQTHHEASLDLARALGAGPAEARALHDLAVLALAEGRPGDAALLLHDALDRWRALHNRQSESGSLLELGRALRATGRPKEALDTMEQALALADAVGAKLQASLAHLALADVYEALGRAGHALRHLRRYQALREEILGTEATARVRSLMAQAVARRARDEAQQANRHATELTRKNEELEALLVELKQAQSRLLQSEKLASLGRLTAGIAHELKNPLNFVTNFAGLSVEMAAELRQALAAGDTAAADDLAADLRTNAATIRRHGGRADAIVVAMMAHARAGTGERRPTDLPALLRQSVEAARQGQIASGAHAPPVTLDLDPAVGLVTLVPEQVGAAVEALVDNALHAVEARAAQGADSYAPTVAVALRAVGGAAEVRVEDNGGGMTDDVRARAFEPFFTTRPAGEGTGFGLSMAWHVAQAQGGTLAAVPAASGGERFVLTLPLG